MVQQQEKENPKTLKDQTKELEETRAALLNMLEDTEEARREAEEGKKRTELIIKNLSDGLLVFDAKGTLEIMNPYAEHLFKTEQAAVLQKSVQDLKTFPAFKELAELLGEKRGQIFRKALNIGEQTVVEATSTPFQLGRRAPGVMVTLHDITREREIERMKSDFVSLAAHQLRTPLTAIKWSTQMLLDGDAGKLAREQEELLRKSSQSTDRMIHLINDLLNVTRIEEGRYLYQPSFEQLGDIVKSMVRSYRDTAKQKKIRLELKLPKKEIPLILLDVEKIRLAVQNLLENALHYTLPGGRVTVRVSHDTKEVLVSLTDTGIGIPQKQQPRVFEKFFRAANARKVDTEGSGLGLYLVHNIVEAHGGTIWFESEEGKGTTFTFSLPIKEETTKFKKKF
ncbi:PAS domain-containing protein [Patescibacteria group bacterium]|nr:PAS domain-containing protein [Patescibacteria group bacterium]